MQRSKVELGGFLVEVVQHIGLALEVQLDAGRFQRELVKRLANRGCFRAETLQVRGGDNSARDPCYQISYSPGADGPGLGRPLDADAVCEVACEIEREVLAALEARAPLALLATPPATLPDDLPY